MSDGFPLADASAPGFDFGGMQTPPFVSPSVPPASDEPDRLEAMKLSILLPMAMKRGRGAVQGLLQGFAQAQAEEEQRTRQQRTDSRAQSAADWQQQYQQGQLQNQRQTQQRQLLGDFTKGIEGLDTPEAIDAYTKLYGQQGQAFGIAPDALAQYAAPYKEPTRLQQRAAESYVKKLKSEYGEKWMETASQFTHRVGGQTVTFDQLLGQAGMAKDPNAPKPAATDRRGFTPREVSLNGQYFGNANFDPDSGRYYDPQSGEALAGKVADYHKPEKPTGGDRPLTSNQRANIIQNRRNQWQRFTKSVIDRQQAVSKIDSGVSALDRGNRNAATQIIIFAFNKLQDETSAVREGEYARSEQLVPFVNRINGALTRLTSGGASMTDADLRALAAEAKNVAQGLGAVSTDAASNLRQGIEEEMSDYGIPSSRVFGGSTIGLRPSGPARSSVPGGPVVAPPAGGVANKYR